MSVVLYDQALVQKIQNLIPSTNIHIFTPDDVKSLYKIIADTNEDKPIELPIIAISRDPSIRIREPARTVLSYDGGRISYDEQTSTKLNAIPIEISYRIDIYTRNFIEADNYMRSLVFNLINHPDVTVDVPYKDKHILHKSALNIQDSVQDNSAIPERLIKGQFSRMTISLSIPDAYMWDVKLYNNVEIIPEIVEQ